MNTTEAKILLQQFKSNDKNAIDRLYALYSRRIFKFAFAYLKTEEDSLDVVQDVFISLWDKRNTMKEDTNLEAYLFTVAKNSVISIFRKKVSEKTYLEHLQQAAVLYHNDSEEKFDYEILSEKIQKLVGQLPEQRRLIFRMSKEKGQSNKSIADELNISVKTVEDHITKARRFIKKHMEEYGLVALLFYELFV